MKKKYLAVLLSVILALAMLSGCGSNGDNPEENPGTNEKSGSDSASGEGSDVTTLVWVAVGEEAEFTQPGYPSYEIIKEFNETHDDIQIAYENYNGLNEIYEVIQTKCSAGSSEYDIISVDSPQVRSYAYNGWLLPLDEYFTEEELADFTDTALENAMYDGKLYAPAMQNSSQVLCYNTKLLEEAGVTLPENDVNNRLTWEEVADIASEVLKVVDPDGSKAITGLAFQQVGRTYQMNMLANSMGGAQIGEDGFTVRGVLDSQPWIDALTWYQTQVENKICSRGIKATETMDNFYNDKSVFFVATVGAISTISMNIDHFDYTCVPAFEGYEDSVGTPCGGWNVGVNVNSAHPDEAAEVVKYLTLGRGNDIRFEVSSHVPARHSLLDDMMAEGSETPRYLQIAAYEAENTAVLRAKTPGYGEYCSAIDTLWEDVRNGSDIQASVENAISTIETAMKKYQR